MADVQHTLELVSFLRSELTQRIATSASLIALFVLFFRFDTSAEWMVIHTIASGSLLLALYAIFCVVVQRDRYNSLLIELRFFAANGKRYSEGKGDHVIAYDGALRASEKLTNFWRAALFGAAEYLPNDMEALIEDHRKLAERFDVCLVLAWMLAGVFLVMYLTAKYSGAVT